MRRRYWAGLAILALVAALWVSCGDDGDEATPQDGQAPAATEADSQVVPVATAAGTAVMAVDAVSGGEINATADIAGTDPFDVDVDILDATIGYQGYQYYLEWDPEVLAFDNHADQEPEDLDLCANPKVEESRIAAGCARVTDTTTFAGPVGTLTFHCVASGTSLLHLVTSGERPVSFSTAMAPRGLLIPTELRDASVTCPGP